MKILFVGGLSDHDQAQSSLASFGSLLRSAPQDVDVDLQSTYIDQLVFTLDNNSFEIFDAHNNLSVKNIDLVFIRGPRLRFNSILVHHVSRYCAWHGIPLVNDYSNYYSATKFAQSVVFLEHHALILQTVYSRHGQHTADHAEQIFGYPYILKSNTGSHGDLNYLVDDRAAVDAIMLKEPTTDFLAQAYCPNDRDYRLLLIGDREIVFVRQGADDSHLNNTSKGGQATEVSGLLPPEIIVQSRAIAKSLGLTIAGVDIMPHAQTGELFFLEINSQPQMTTGVLLDEKKRELGELLATFQQSQMAD